MDEYKSRLSAYLSDMVREELEKYDGGFTEEWNDQRKKNAEVLGYKLSGTSDISEGIKDPKLKVGQKIRFKKSNRVFTLKKITHGNRGIPEDPAGTSYMFIAPGNRKEYHTKKTWAQAIKKGWLSLESVNEEITDWQGKYDYGFKFKKGQLIKDINPDCPHHGSEGEVTKVTKDEVTYTVRNNGKTYKVGDELTKTKEQLTPLSVNESGILYKAGVKKYGKEGMAKILSAAGKEKSHAEIGAIKDKYEKESVELDEGGMGILTSDQSDVLQAIVMRNKNKSTKSILSVALKSGHFKGVDKKELLGYIDGARQFVKYMKSHPMESVNEDRDYKAEYKKFQSSTKSKKYRAELNQYNRKKGTYGNGDGKDASHKGGKIAGFEKESTNRGRREKSRLKKEDIREDIGIETYLGGIVKSLNKAGIKPKTAKVMKHGFSKSKDKIGFFIDVLDRKREKYTLQLEVDRDGNLWYLSAPRDMKLGKWADTSKIVRSLKAISKLPDFGQSSLNRR